MSMFHVHATGQFTLRDMYEQFQNIMKMGPFGQIMVDSCWFLYCYKYIALIYSTVWDNQEIYRRDLFPCHKCHQKQLV